MKSGALRKTPTVAYLSASRKEMAMLQGFLEVSLGILPRPTKHWSKLEANARAVAATIQEGATR